MDEDAPRITIVTEYFYPEEASTAQLLTSLATGLQGDFDVSVLTGRPNYHPGDETESVPTREQHKGVSIERLPATRLDKDTLPFRVVNWITFTLLVFWRLARSRGSDDVVLVLSNPPLLPLAAWAAKRICDISYGYLIYDMYPDFPVALEMISADSTVARWWEKVMRMVYRDADRIVVLGDSMKERLTQKMSEEPGFAPTKIEVIPNWEVRPGTGAHGFVHASVLRQHRALPRAPHGHRRHRAFGGAGPGRHRVRDHRRGRSQVGSPAVR